MVIKERFYMPINSNKKNKEVNKKQKNEKNEKTKKGKTPNKKRKKYCCLKFCGSGCIFFVLIIILLLNAIGIIKIPIISSLIYHEPKPEEVIIPTEEKVKSLQDKLENLPLDEENFKIEITQDELTSYLVYNQPKNKIELESPQIAITSEEIKLFGQVQKKPLKIAFRVDFIPWIQNGQLKINIQKIYFGSIKIPSFLINRLQETITEELEKSLPEDEIFFITNIQLKDKKMIISGEIQYEEEI